MGEDNVYKVTGDGPSISVTSSETQPSYLNWSNTCSSAGGCSTGPTVNWSSGDTWSGTFSSKTIASLTFRFDNTNTATNATSFVITNTSKSTVSVYGSTAKASAITADFENKSLGTDSSKINLELIFGSDTNAKKVTVSKLSTLYGNLAISSSTTATAKDAYTYDVTLDTLKGNLTISGTNYALKGSVTINQSMVGSIYLSADSSVGTASDSAALTVNFGENATMKGDIADKSNGSAGIRKDIYFKGGGTVLTGNIISFGTGSGSSGVLNTSAGNRVYFTQGDMKGYIIASTGQYSASTNGSAASDASRKGLNVVIFGDSGTTTTQNLTGGILASDVNLQTVSDTSAVQATNVIVLADSTTLNIKTDSSSNGTLNGSFAGGVIKGGDNGQKGTTTFQVTSGSIIARNYGVNEIRIYKGSTLNLNDGSGSIKSVVNDVGSVSNGSALNKINFLSENGVIKGSIVADNSKNASGSKQASALNLVIKSKSKYQNKKKK